MSYSTMHKGLGVALLVLLAHSTGADGKMYKWSHPRKQPQLRAHARSDGNDQVLLQTVSREDPPAVPMKTDVMDGIVNKYASGVDADSAAAAANTMKFMEARQGAPGKFTPKVYKVAPGEKGGLTFKPSEGQNDPEVHIRARADFAEGVQQTTSYLGDHAFNNDLKTLLQEIDKSQNFMKGLKLRIVEKENFIDSLVQREDLLQSDVNKDKQSLDNLHSHVKALRARIERLKKQKMANELNAQLSSYEQSASVLAKQAKQMQDLRDSLRTKIDSLTQQQDVLGSKEIRDMRESIDVGEPKPAAAAAGPGDDEATDVDKLIQEAKAASAGGASGAAGGASGAAGGASGGEGGSEAAAPAM